MCGGRITGFLLVWPGLTWTSWHTQTDLYRWTWSSLCHSRCSLWLCAACLRGTSHLVCLFWENSNEKIILCQSICGAFILHTDYSRHFLVLIVLIWRNSWTRRCFLFDNTSCEGGRILSRPLVNRLLWAQSNLMGFFVKSHILFCLHAGAPTPRVAAANHQWLLAFVWSLFSLWPAGSWPHPWADVWGLGIKCKPLQPPPQRWSHFTPTGADSLHRLVWIEAQFKASQRCLKELKRAHCSCLSFKFGSYLFTYYS